MTNLDQLIAKLRSHRPTTPNAAFCRPLRVADLDLLIFYLEYLAALDSGLTAMREWLQATKTGSNSGDTAQEAGEDVQGAHKASESV